MKLLGAYFFLLLGYTYFSYFLTDPNLVFSSWPMYWNWQVGMWQAAADVHRIIPVVYGGLMAGIFCLYFVIAKYARLQWLNSFKSQLLVVLIVSIPLVLANNALSHDIFNYIFNAKMVSYYQVDPHVKVALDFPDDPWLRFMHNVHTPAPYWYGWTAWSLIPYWIGMGKFTFTWLLFKIFSLISVVSLLYGVRSLYKVVYEKELPAHAFVLLFLNPLFLVELIGNAHNDGWMLVPAVFGVIFFWKAYKLLQQKKFSSTAIAQNIFFSISFILLSATTKYVTLVLVPIVIGALVTARNSLSQTAKKVATFLGTSTSQLIFFCIAGALFVPLFTARSQQFHPWYLTWVLIWVPFIEWKWLRGVIIIFSVTSMFRYIPWMWERGYTNQVLVDQKMITWAIPALFLVYMLGKWLMSEKKRSNSK